MVTLEIYKFAEDLDTEVEGTFRFRGTVYFLSVTHTFHKKMQTYKRSIN